MFVFYVRDRPVCRSGALPTPRFGRGRATDGGQRGKTRIRDDAAGIALFGHGDQSSQRLGGQRKLRIVHQIDYEQVLVG